jgi:hypothetical protein
MDHRPSRIVLAAFAAVVIAGGIIPLGAPSSAAASDLSVVRPVEVAPDAAPTDDPQPTDTTSPDPVETTTPDPVETTAPPTETPTPTPTPTPDEAETPKPEDGTEQPSDIAPQEVQPGAQPIEFQAPKPVIVGNPRDGSTIQVSAGYWTPSPTTVVFQWFADGRGIAGATGRGLKVTADLVGKKLSANVKGTRVGYVAKWVSSDQTAPVWKGVTDEALLLSKIKTRLDDHGWKYTVAIRELNGAKRSTSVYGASKREPASTSKLFIAYAVLDNIDNGILSFSRKTSSGTTVKDCLRVLIEVSDNYCARELMAVVGRTKLNSKLASEGYTGTQFSSAANSSGWNKTSTANDLALLLSRLQNKQLLSVSGTTHLLTLMERQVWRSRLASGLPDGVRSASKPGELWLSSGMVQLDVGIVYGPTSTYVLTVMGNGNATKEAIKAISKTVFLHLQGYPSSTKTRVYPAQQMTAKASTALRSGPGGSTIATIPAGARVEVISSQRMWYYVKVNGRNGWMSATVLASRWAA